jgi:hypothetical protein
LVHQHNFCKGGTPSPAAQNTNLTQWLHTRQYLLR